MAPAILTEATRKTLQSKHLIVVPGLEKCGTTSLHELLAGAENVSVPRDKEIDFFEHNFGRGFEWYLANYDLQRPVLLDATPTYHWHNAALWRIRECCPNVLILLMLRNPVARAYSAYCHRLNYFFVRDFKENQNMHIYHASIDRFARDANAETRGFQFVFTSYKETIARVLSQYNASFAEHELLLVGMEEFVAKPAGIIQEMEARLGCTLGLAGDAVVPKANSLPFPRIYHSRELREIYGDWPATYDDATYFCANGKVERIADGAMYGYLKRLEELWLRPLDRDGAQYIYDKFYRDELAEIEQRFGLNIDNWSEPKEYRPVLTEAERRPAL